VKSHSKKLNRNKIRNPPFKKIPYYAYNVNLIGILALNQPRLNLGDYLNSPNFRTLTILMISIVIIFLVRSIWTIPIEVAGDAVRKFYAAAEIVRTGDWAILLQNHHTMRWSIVLPQAFITWVFGTRYEVYYILPLLFFALYFIIILYALKDHLNTSQKILLAVLLFADPMSFRNSSQLMTAGPSIFYAISACYVLVTHSKRSSLAVILAAVLFFCAYGSQATYISFAAGGFLWLALIQRSWKPAFIFAGALFGLLAIECLFFNYLSGWELTFGRIEALLFGPHLEGLPGTERYTVTFRQLFTRWLQLPVLDIALSTIFFISGLVFVNLKKKPALPGFISCVYLVGVCFALFASFAIMGIDPIRPVQRLLPRYLAPFLPFATIISVYFLTLIAASNRKVWDTRLVLFAALLALSIIAIPQMYNHSQHPRIKIRTEAYIWKADEEYTYFAKQIHDGNLVYKGRKKFVVKMITGFKYPDEKLSGKTIPSTTSRSTEVKCVNKLVDIPSRLNVRECKPGELKKIRT